MFLTLRNIFVLFCVSKVHNTNKSQKVISIFPGGELRVIFFNHNIVQTFFI